MSDLGSFQGKPVVASKVIVKKAGDGLTKPLAAEPRAFTSGERVPMLLWGTWGSISFDPSKEGYGFIQVHDFDTEEAAVLDHVDPKMLEDLLADQREKVRAWEVEQMIEDKRRKDAKAGQVAADVDGAGDGSDLVVPDGVIDPDAVDAAADADWEASARASGVSTIGVKQARKAKG